MSHEILIIEDSVLVSMSLKDLLEEKGYSVSVCETAKESAKILKKTDFSVAILDMMLPDANGRDLLKKWKKSYPDMAVIIFTAHGDIDSAVDCLKAGAYDFLPKPVDNIKLLSTIENAIKHSALSNQVVVLKELRKRSDSGVLNKIIGDSPAMMEIVNLAKQVAQSDYSCLLITGESGTGKGLFAKTIHKAGKRKDKPFVEVNCSALPATLIESELFGHKRGAFTDAKEDKIGLFEMADGGTLFLDEIGDMDLALQSKLLKVMEEQTFRRIGDTKEIKVDVAIIAATNQMLEQHVECGKFRMDLYYRLNVIPLKLIPLRERMKDVMSIADHFLMEFSLKFGKQYKGFSKDAVKELNSYAWPGNVRELRNVVERGCILSQSDEINTKELMIPKDLTATRSENFAIPPLPLADIEKMVIESAMNNSDGNKNKAAKVLGIHRTTLYKKLEEYGLD